MSYTVGDVYDFYKEYPEYIGKISVKNRYGYNKILACEITAYDSIVHKIKTSNKYLECSPEHRLLDENNNWILAKNLIPNKTYIQTDEGNQLVIENSILDKKEDLYDFQVDVHKEYYTNGIVSHNSTIIDSITFGLYGKAFRDIKKDLLINNINKKNALIEIDLIGIDGKPYLIRRGLKPNIFEIYENGKLVNQHAEIKEYQEYLETYVLGINFITFSQTVIISKTKYTPFMKLRSGERRQFVESILNIEVFGDMLKLQTKKISDLKSAEVTLQNDLKINVATMSSKIESLKRLKSLLNQAKLASENQIKDDIKLLQDKISDLTNKINVLSKSKDNTDYSESVIKYEKFNKLLLSYESKYNILKDELKKFNDTSDKCHVCGNNIDISHIEIHIKECKQKILDTSNTINKIKDEIDKLQEIYDLANLQNNHNSKIDHEIKNCKFNISAFNDDIHRLSNKKIDTTEYDNQIDLLKNEIRLLKTECDNQNKDLSQLLTDINTNNFVLSLLKDSGIKSAIIQNSIPIINKTINEYLHKFGFFITFELNSEFDETIYVRGVNTLVYSSFSEGEKLRIDLALIFAWRELSMMQSGLSCNLLFFDEMTDSSMDNEGVELFIKTINTFTNTNTWIITHTPEKLESYVRSIIEIEKYNGFSRIK